MTSPMPDAAGDAMDAQRLRTLASALPEVEERSHHGQADFRVCGKIFASLDRDGRVVTFKLSLDCQARVLDDHPGMCRAASGRWGRSGWTEVPLAALGAPALSALVAKAWTTVAPRELLEAYPRRV